MFKRSKGNPQALSKKNVVGQIDEHIFWISSEYMEYDNHKIRRISVVLPQDYCSFMDMGQPDCLQSM